MNELQNQLNLWQLLYNHFLQEAQWFCTNTRPRNHLHEQGQNDWSRDRQPLHPVKFKTFMCKENTEMIGLKKIQNNAHTISPKTMKIK